MLRNDFNDIIRDYGFNVLVVKQNKKLRCSCWNDRTQETTRLCEACFGLGYVPIIEKHTVRDRFLSLPETLARAIDTDPYGQITVVGRTYYCQHDMGLALKDLIIEVDWSPTGKPIYNGGDISEVNFIDYKRFEHGEIAYLKVAVKDEPVRKEIRGIRIANTNGIKNYEILGGDIR